MIVCNFDESSRDRPYPRLPALPGASRELPGGPFSLIDISENGSQKSYSNSTLRNSLLATRRSFDAMQTNVDLFLCSFVRDEDVRARI